jgi:MtrB/PioB family decaheme-associated outer membrane protein
MSRSTESALIPLAALALAVAAAAEQPDTSSWKCESCPFEEDEVDSELEVGAGHVDDASAKSGDYTGLDEDGGFAIAAGSASQVRSSGWYWSVAGEDLGLDARSASIEGGKAGRLELALTYDNLPHTLFDTTFTPFLGAGTSSLILPPGWVRAGVTQQMTALAPNLRRIDIESERETIGAAAEWIAGRRWSTFADYRREERDGVWRQGGAFGFSAVELPRPVDYVTDSAMLGVEYGGERLTARLAYDGSFFSNKRTELSWDNPYTGSPRGRLALAPDNLAHHLDASLNWRLGARAALSAAAVLGRLEQDDDFLPYTINPAIPVPLLPRASFDGKVDTTHLSLALSSDLGGIWDFLDGLRVRADVRYDERDNASPRDAYAYVVTDTFTAGPEINNPYSFEHTRFRASAAWDLRRLLPFIPASQRVRLSGGWRRDDIERTLQEAPESTEDMGWGRLDYRPAGWLEIGAKVGAANREVDTYTPPAAQIGGPQNPLLRKYNMADREREFAELDVSLTPLAWLSFGATGSYSSNDYVSSPLGLQRSRDAGATFESSLSFGERASLSLHYGWEEIDAFQTASQSFGAPDWSGVTEDTLRSGGASLRFPDIRDKLTLDLRWFFANTEGSIATFSVGGPSELPQLRTRMNGGEIAGLYRWSPALTLRAAVRYEHFDANDWQLDFVEPATVPTLLSLGADAYDYDVELFMLSFRYRFGATAEPTASEEGEQEQE